MEETKQLQVRVTLQFILDLQDVYSYGVETFGIKLADIYENEILQLIGQLSSNYLLFPECRHLPSKSKMYRWIILESHLIIYRINAREVQVLRIVHSKRSITYIKSARRIK